MWRPSSISHTLVFHHVILSFFSFFSAIQVTDTIDGESKDFTWVAPVLVILMALIVILICCCFLRVDPSAPHSDELEAFRRAREAKYTHDVNAMDEIALEQGHIR